MQSISVRGRMAELDAVLPFKLYTQRESMHALSFLSTTEKHPRLQSLKPRVFDLRIRWCC